MKQLTRSLERCIGGGNVLAALALVDKWSDVGNGSDVARIEKSRSDRSATRIARNHAPKLGWSRARCPHRSRDTPQVRPCRLGGGIH
ncbi:hypothetical protein ABQ085_11205, partial [Xanthomonas hortorum pv. hederae]|uniref:hypothetical protein n=1 Tax=Xanthomonas hortorum TaxID=56454 RepID=UPI0032E931E3